MLSIGLVGLDDGIAEIGQVKTETAVVIGQAIGNATDLRIDVDTIGQVVVGRQEVEDVAGHAPVHPNAIIAVAIGRDVAERNIIAIVAHPQSAGCLGQRQIVQGHEIRIIQFDQGVHGTQGLAR